MNRTEDPEFLRAKALAEANRARRESASIPRATREGVVDWVQGFFWKLVGIAVAWVIVVAAGAMIVKLVRWGLQ